MFAIGRSFPALALIAVAACAGHRASSGSVIMKLSDTQAHVRLTERGIPVGAQVRLYRHRCVSQYGKRYECKQRVAIGTIAQKMGDRYALVTFPRGTQLEQGYTIEQL